MSDKDEKRQRRRQAAAACEDDAAEGGRKKTKSKSLMVLPVGGVELPDFVPLKKDQNDIIKHDEDSCGGT